MKRYRLNGALYIAEYGVDSHELCYKDDNEPFCDFDEETIRRISLIDNEENPVKALCEDGMSEEEAWVLIGDLVDMEILCRYDRIWKSGFALMFTVIKMKDTERYRIPAAIILAMITLFFVPALYVVLSEFAEYIRYGLLINHDDFLKTGIVLGLLGGIFLHEIAHASACIVFRGIVREIGFQIGIPLGAYALIAHESIRSKSGRIITLIAGVLMNVILGGVCLLISKFAGRLDGCFFIAGVANIELAMINILVIGNLDGARVLREVLGNRRRVRFAPFLSGFFASTYVMYGVLLLFNLALLMEW